jgi:hypothetical protein
LQALFRVHGGILGHDSEEIDAVQTETRYVEGALVGPGDVQ